MAEMHDVQGGGVTRRNFMKLTTGAISSIPLIGGNFVVPVAAQAEDGYSTQKYGATIEDSGKYASLGSANTYPMLPYYVFYRVADMGEKDINGNPLAVVNAKVTIFPENDLPAVISYTDRAGVASFNIKEIADNPFGEETLTSYNLEAYVTVEKDGYRKFDGGKRIIMGGTADSLPVRKNTYKEPYASKVTYQEVDVLHTERIVQVFNVNPHKQLLHIDFENVGGDSVVVELKGEGIREPLQRSIVRVKDRKISCDFQGQFQTKSVEGAENPDQIPIDTALYVVVTEKERAYSENIQLRAKNSDIENPDVLEGPAATGIDMPIAKNEGKPETEGVKYGLSFTFPEDWFVIGGSTITPTLPGFPINLYVDPAGYFQLTATVLQKPIAKYDSTKNKKGAAKPAVDEWGDPVTDEDGNALDKDGNVIKDLDNGWANGDELKWSSPIANRDAYTSSVSAIKDKFKGASMLFNLQRQKLSNNWQSIKKFGMYGIPTKMRTAYNAVFQKKNLNPINWFRREPVLPDGKGIVAIEFEEQRKIWEDEIGPYDPNKSDFADGFVNMYLVDYGSYWEKREQEANGDAQSVGAQAEEEYDLSEFDKTLLATLLAQAEEMNLTQDDYASMHLDENSSDEDVHKAIAIAQLQMITEIIREEQADRRRMLAKGGITSSQANNEGAASEPFEGADESGIDDPFNDNDGASERANVPEKEEEKKKNPWSKNMSLSFTVSIDLIAKWMWPQWDETQSLWLDGTVLGMAKVKPCLTFSFKLSKFIMIWIIPLTISIGIDVIVNVDLGLAIIRTFEASELDKDIDKKQGQYKHGDKLIDWGALFPVMASFGDYHLDYASSGLVATLTIMPWFSVGVGCQAWQPVCLKVKFIFTFIFSATAHRHSEGPYKDKPWWRVQITFLLQVQLIVDFFLFTNTWSKYYFADPKGNPMKFLDTWEDDNNSQMAPQADLPTGSFKSSIVALTKDDMRSMTLLSNEMLSTMSEMDGEQALEEQGDDEVFDWETVREEDIVASVSDGTNITYAVYRMPEYREEEVLEAQAIALGGDAEIELGDSENADIALGALDSQQKSGRKKANSLRRTSTVIYKPSNTGLLSMADGNDVPEPDIQGLGSNGWLNPTDVLLTPEPVVGDPRMKVIEYATTVRDGEGVTVTAVFRICSVVIAGKPRSRILMSLLDARDLQGGKLPESYQNYLRQFDKKIIDFDVNDIEGINRSDMYDYDFDVMRKTVVEGDGEGNLGSDMLQIVVVSGVRKEGDNTGLLDASTSTVFTYLTIPVENLLQPILVYKMKISILGTGIISSAGAYHMISDMRLQGGETINDNYAIIAFIDRASDTPEGTMEVSSKKVSVNVGFMLVDFIEECFLVPNITEVANNLGAHSTDPRIVELQLSPKIGGYYLLSLKLFTDSAEPACRHYFLIGVPDDLANGTHVADGSKYFTFDKLKYVCTEEAELVPCVARDCFFSAFVDIEDEEEKNAYVEYGKSLEGTDYSSDDYNNGTVYSPTDFADYIKEFDKNRVLHKVWFEDMDKNAPVMRSERIGPKNFNVSDFGINTNGTFIFWPENTEKAPDEYGSPIYAYNPDTFELEVVDRKDDDSKHVIRASRLHENLAGEITFSKPFIIGEVSHEVTETVVASARNKYSPLTLLSKVKVPLMNEVGDDYVNYSGDTIHPACNIYFTAIPNVNCAIVDECYNASEYITPGCNSVFDIVVRNAGNTYLSGCTVKLCAHTIDDDGNEEIIEIESSKTEIIFDSDCLLETGEMPINDEGVYENVEDDWSLAPGQRAAYRISLPIPEDWKGDVTISAIASEPIMAEHGGLTGLVDDEEIEYMSYSVAPGEYDIHTFIPRITAEEPVKKLSMTTIKVGVDNPSYVLYDSPLIMGDASQTSTDGTDETEGSAGTNGSAGQASANSAGTTAGAATGVGASGNGGATSRVPTARTSDASMSVIPELLAATGAAMLAYEKRRAKNENIDENAENEE